MLINTLIQSKLQWILLAIVLLVMPITSVAQNITIIYDDNSHYQTNFANILSKQLSPNFDVNVITKVATILAMSISISSVDTIINLNNDVTKNLIESNIQTTTLHALTTFSRAKGFAPCLPDCTKKLPNHHFFVLDQPASRQLNLIQLINPNFKNIGIVVTNQSIDQLKQLKKIATHKKLIINEHISTSENAHYQIDDVSKSSDIILAIADTDIYNAASLSQILLTSYRYGTPIIGFSKGFIRAGAIAGTVSSIEQLAQHLSETILMSNNINKVLENSLIYPKYFSVISNRNVAKSLNLHFPNDAELEKKLNSYEDIR